VPSQESYLINKGKDRASNAHITECGMPLGGGNGLPIERKSMRSGCGNIHIYIIGAGSKWAIGRTAGAKVRANVSRPIQVNGAIIAGVITQI